MDRCDHILKAAKILNVQRYAAGLGFVRRNRKVQWISCERGDVLMAALYPRHAGERPPAYDYIEADDTMTLEELRLKVLMTHCKCHKALRMDELMELMYE